MAKRNTLLYWISTAWLALGMLSTGVVQLMHLPEETENMSRLGFPAYLMTLLGVWKLLGVLAILLPKFPLLKEWAYAGFFFAMSGAVYAHIVTGDAPQTLFGPVLLLALTISSWYLRPADRKLNLQ